MKHETLNSRVAVSQGKQDRNIKQVSWRNYQIACEKRWEQTWRFLPIDTYTDALSLCWEERLPANKAVQVIRFVESNWDNEDEECPQMVFDFVRENKTALNAKGLKRVTNGEER